MILIRHGLGMATAFLLCATSATAQWQAGRFLENGPTISFGLTGGAVFGLDGEVQETERPLYAYTDDHSGSPPERYSWKELGFDDSFAAFGFVLERQGRYATWLLDLSLGRTRLEGTADRDYYIGVSRVSYEGRDYEHMHIPAGESFHGEIDAYTLGLHARITPASYRSRGGVVVVPWIHLGLFGFAGDYVIDAGEARDVIEYERPPREYVVGGRGTGLAGILVPELGLGGEIAFPLNALTRLSIQGFVGGMNLRVRSGWFGVGARNEKVVDLEYLTYGGGVHMERTLNRRMDLWAGINVLVRNGTADVRAQDRPTEEVLARREKFDKTAHFEMASVMAVFGLRF